MEKVSGGISEKELRAQQTEKIVSFLDRIGAYEYAQKLLSDSEARKDFSFEEFRDFVVRLNGIARDITIDERETDGDGVYLSGFDEALVPNHKDKEDILRDAYSVIDRVTYGDVAYLIPAVVNAIHLFADGNGRTSRILHTLLTEFDSAEDFVERLRLVVGEFGNYYTPDINPGIVSPDIEKIVLMRHGFANENGKDWSSVFPEGFYRLFLATDEVTSKKAQEFMKFRHIDQAECFICAREYLVEKGMLLQNVSQLPEGIALSPAKMDQNLTESDWDEIMKRYYFLKKEHVEVLIDAFVQPDKYKNLDGSMNLRDFFIKRIRERLENNKK